MRRYHHLQFSDFGHLANLKREAGQTVSVCIPTRNESETIGDIVATIRHRLVEDVPLVDEILVVDSDSDDGTRAIAAAEGARVLRSAEIAPETGSHTGKGENLWKGLLASSGDLVCYIDGDISNFHPGFVAGLLGPLLTCPDIDYVKAHYERPLAVGNAPQTGGGGRLSDILVRPLISLFFPELHAVVQPLSGEYASRRSLLESLSFPTGYGVEIGHLIDLARGGMLERTAQCDLERRVHRNRPDAELGDAAFAILHVVLRRLQRDGRIHIEETLPLLHGRWAETGGEPQWIERKIPEPERPPVIDLR